MRAHLRREIAVVERVDALVREQLERRRELGERARVAVHRVALRRVAQQWIEYVEQVLRDRRQLEALAGEIDGRRKERGPRDPAPTRMRNGQSERSAGNGN